MILAHYEPLSLNDFPRRLATTVFTVGCNFACPYCHNPELVNVTIDTPRLAEESFFAFLERRRDKLSGVCITGGEPTLQADLPRFIDRIRSLGFAVKLDTNGSNPDMLRFLLEQGSVAYVAMDVKAPPSRYGEVTRNAEAFPLVKTSIQLLADFNVASEFRTTVLPLLFNEADIEGIVAMLPSNSHYVIQNFVPTKTLDQKFLQARGFDIQDLEALAQNLRRLYPAISISTRGGI
ncbi:MAG: anaerobic ribonucleoside-triphosphate reductase activating protein [Candidatus Cryosericum sp.]